MSFSSFLLSFLLKTHGRLLLPFCRRIVAKKLVLSSTAFVSRRHSGPLCPERRNCSWPGSWGRFLHRVQVENLQVANLIRIDLFISSLELEKFSTWTRFKNRPLMCQVVMASLPLCL
jgi:hypothetical protein